MKAGNIDMSRRLVEVCNRWPLPNDLMFQLNEVIGALSPERREAYERRIPALMEALARIRPNMDRRDLVDVIMSFDFRMYALVGLRDRPEWAGFGIKGDGGDEPDSVSEALIAAAGQAELHIDDTGDAAFEPKAFFDLALRLQPAEGRA